MTINLRARVTSSATMLLQTTRFLRAIGVTYSILWQIHRSPTQVIADAGNRRGWRDDRSTLTQSRLEREPSHAAQCQRHSCNGFRSVESGTSSSVCLSNEQVASVHEVARAFRRIAPSPHRRLWHMAAVSARFSGTKLYNCTNGLFRDMRLSRRHSRCPGANGPVQGHVNKLKVLKRQMYGRANLDILHLRLVNAQ